MDSDSPVWRHWWEALAAKHFFVRFDQRGSGLSDRTVPEFSFASWVSDLECVVDTFGLERFILFGMSQGGPIAVEYAARHPERLSHLVIVGGYARGWAQRGQPTDEQKALLTLIKHGWATDNPAFRQVFTTQFMPDATADQMRWFNDLERASASPENALLFQEEVGNINVTESARSVRVPTLVFHSQDDARVPADQGRELAALIPTARLVLLPSKNHILLENESAWPIFVQQMEAFLAGPASADALPGLRPEVQSLSSRELEVLRLIARGFTDRDISADLGISTRTVGNHVRSILNKTGCSNRTAAAIWAARSSIV
ncbi:MAG TPA: alpha/beta fold hydrolase [Dehalococcoidia bacterium]|nr:alpha/beta fold hydrolase [Dehalococcoidia bacterium]